MKKLLLTLTNLVLVLSIFAQNQPKDQKSKGMAFVPAGSFQRKTTLNSESRTVNTTVEAFWMSNEVTNVEYREFVNWVKKNPNQRLYQVKLSREVISDPQKGTMKDTIIRKIIPIEVSSIISELIDPQCLERANKEYKNYFTDPKYNDYPVVGVSFKMAEYYCLWKTTMENEKLKEQGLPNMHAYRIPLEAEWEYVAQQNIKSKATDASTGKIQKVNEGTINEFGLMHLNDNVSEWVTSNKEETGLVRGGSWKSGSSIAERIITDPNSKEPFVGFRIVQSYLQTGTTKKK